MIEKKVFILDKDKGKLEEASLKVTMTVINAEYIHENEEKIKLNVTLEEIKRRDLPLGYDIYLIHTSNIADGGIEELRRKQPWCRIYAITGHSSLPALNGIIDGIWHQIDKSILKEELVKDREYDSGDRR
ncbi:MAG: hypothetical protein WC781_03505 [Candidatus Pacearchaeota archaeon]|jgi:hypothetical protein